MINNNGVPYYNNGNEIFIPIKRCYFLNYFNLNGIHYPQYIFVTDREYANRLNLDPKKYKKGMSHGNDVHFYVRVDTNVHPKEGDVILKIIRKVSRKNGLVYDNYTYHSTVTSITLEKPITLYDDVLSIKSDMTDQTKDSPGKQPDTLIKEVGDPLNTIIRDSLKDLNVGSNATIDGVKNDEYQINDYSTSKDVSEVSDNDNGKEATDAVIDEVKIEDTSKDAMVGTDDAKAGTEAVTDKVNINDTLKDVKSDLDDVITSVQSESKPLTDSLDVSESKAQADIVTPSPDLKGTKVQREKEVYALMAKIGYHHQMIRLLEKKLDDMSLSLNEELFH